MKIGSLFSGVAGLDMAVEQFFDADVAWFVEHDAAPSKVLTHHYPGVPNYGDVTTVDWASVEPVDILTGGFPCQDVSLAGARRGLKDGTRSGLWSECAKAIDILRPSLVVIENVRGLLSAEAVGVMESDAWNLGDRSSRPTLRALGAVLGNLAELGYDTEWCGVRAADAGAPHNRFRVFILAYPASVGHERAGRARGWWPGPADSGGVAADASSGGWGRRAQDTQRDQIRRNAPPRRSADVTADAGSDGFRRDTELYCQQIKPALKTLRGEHAGRHSRTEWGQYAPAIERWGRVLGRPAPSPVRYDGRNGAPRLNPELTEWMMGWPAGWVTDPAIGLTRNEQLKACGNGVVTQQALLALALLWQRILELAPA